MRIATLALTTLLGAAQAAPLTLTNPQGEGLAQVMVTYRPVQSASQDKSDNGYSQPGTVQPLNREVTLFTDAAGRVNLPDFAGAQLVRLRKPGFKDQQLTLQPGEQPAPVALRPETDPRALAEQKPANVWFASLDLGDPALKKHFILQCGFCHQQGTQYLRWARTEAEWTDTFQRMIGYGARLHDEAQSRLPSRLVAGYGKLNAEPEKLGQARPWDAGLGKDRIMEYPIGDSFSQMHDLLAHSNGKIYVGDNLQDRLYEIDTKNDTYVVHKLPKQPHDELGGLLAGRLKQFPKHETYLGIHSFAESARDGHIFITASVQRRLVEFAPESGQFTVHEMDQGFYPHTVRIDSRDRVWFTLALSNQIAMLDRATGQFHYFDLPARGVRESISLGLTGLILKLVNWGWLSLADLPIDEQSTGLPLPYGIDIAPDDSVWFARLHTDAIGRIDPDTFDTRLIDTPFTGPRRLRADRDGNLWISAFAEGQVVKYTPASNRFTHYDLPTEPIGSDTPYSLNVDRARHQLWVNGTASDTLIRFDIASESWRVYPLPRRVSFTRDVEIAEDGTVYTTNSSFPSWHIEDGQPTLIELVPGDLE